MLDLGSCSELDNLPNINGNLKSFEYIGSHGSAISQLLSSVADSNNLKNFGSKDAWFGVIACIVIIIFISFGTAKFK